jgi:hypothetical protein
MKERVFFLWRMFNRISISFFVLLYLISIATNLISFGLDAFFIFPELILLEIADGKFVSVWFVVIFLSWLVGWVMTGKHPWNISS